MKIIQSAIQISKVGKIYNYLTVYYGREITGEMECLFAQKSFPATWQNYFKAKLFCDSDCKIPFDQKLHKYAFNINDYL